MSSDDWRRLSSGLPIRDGNASTVPAGARHGARRPAELVKPPRAWAANVSDGGSLKARAKLVPEAPRGVAKREAGLLAEVIVVGWSHAAAVP